MCMDDVPILEDDSQLTKDFKTAYNAVAVSGGPFGWCDAVTTHPQTGLAITIFYDFHENLGTYQVEQEGGGSITYEVWKYQVTVEI